MHSTAWNWCVLFPITDWHALWISGELSADLVYVRSDWVGGQEAASDVEWAISTLFPSLWNCTSSWRFCWRPVSHWNSTSRILLPLHGRKRGKNIHSCERRLAQPRERHERFFSGLFTCVYRDWKKVDVTWSPGKGKVNLLPKTLSIPGLGGHRGENQQKWILTAMHCETSGRPDGGVWPDCTR